MTNQKMCFCAKRIEDSCQLHGNITGTYHGHPLWLLLDVEEAVRVDAQISTWNIISRGLYRSSTCSDADVIGFNDMSLLLKRSVIISQCHFYPLLADQLGMS